MYREIKFRGYSKELNKWFIGSLDNTLNWADFIIVHEHGFGVKYRIEPESVGQYTGLKDKNGVEIYEGDTLGMSNVYGDIIAVVFFEQGRFKYTQKYKNDRKGFLEESTHDIDFDINPYEVIGNIHENPELLQATE